MCSTNYKKNVKVIAGEECLSQHQLLVGDVVISVVRRKKKRMHISRLKLWKLREPNVKQVFARLEADRKDQIFEADSVESKWNAMKAVLQSCFSGVVFAIG